MPRNSKYTYLETFIFNALRRASLKWPPRNVAKMKARRERGKYECAGCGELFGPKDIFVDHKEPVIDPAKGYIDWNEYIPRMFCSADNLQILCRSCHNSKTKAENKARREAKNG